MDIRESLNKNSWIVIVVAVAAIVVVIWVAIGAFVGSVTNNRAFYSTDDGKTWFTDDADRLAPLDKDGKPAYLAIVFKCKSGKPFVAYMQRYTYKAKAAIEKAKNRPKGRPPENINELMQARTIGMEYKKPGDKDWINQSDLRNVAMLMQVKCPTGGEVEPVEP